MWMFTVPGRTPSSDVYAAPLPAPDGSTAQCLGLGAVGNAREWLFVDFRLCEGLVLLRSEVLLNLFTQAEHSTGRKEAAILSGPIVWPPGLGNQTALWPGSGLPLLPLLVGLGEEDKEGGAGGRGVLPSHGFYFVFPTASLRGLWPQVAVPQCLKFLLRKESGE